MAQPENISVREFNIEDSDSIVDYFLQANESFLHQMGVDVSKLPGRSEWLKLLKDEYDLPFKERKFYYLTWLINDIPVGHSNINKIIFGEEAYMHLHMWHSEKRKKGMGHEFIKMSLPYYFDRFKLKRLYCEPNAFNTAPNKTLEKSGFQFIKQYDTTPGWINYYQTVNRWCLELLDYEQLRVTQH